MEWIEGKEKVSEFLKKYKYVLAILFLGLSLMMIPEKNDDSKVEMHQEDKNDVTLQDSLEDILGKIKGAGRVNVLLTEYSGEELVYQSDETFSGSSDTSNTKKETVILSDSSRGESGLVRRVISPIYQGAIVVCQGADSAAVRLAIVEAVSKVTGLSSNQISVLKMK